MFVAQNVYISMFLCHNIYVEESKKIGQICFKKMRYALKYKLCDVKIWTNQIFDC